MTRENNPLARHGGVSYLEIPAIDPARSAAFYHHVVGWTIDQRSASDFRFSEASGMTIGKWVTGRAASREPGLVLYLYVDDLDAAIAHAVAHGGEIARPIRPQGDTRDAEVRDPAGNVIGLWQFARG